MSGRSLPGGWRSSSCFVAFSDDPCGVAEDLPCGPPDEAAALVPADAYAYPHLQADSDSEQAQAMAAIADRLPQLSQVAAEAIARAVGRPSALGLLRSIGPWLGDEAALATVRGAGGEPSPLALFAVGDPGGASSFAARLGGGAGEAVRYRGAELTTYSGGLTTALHEDFLLLGSPLRRPLRDRRAAGGDSLAADEAAERDRLELPDVPAGRRLCLRGRGRGPARGARAVTDQLDTFVDLGATRGSASRSRPRPTGSGLSVVSLLDPERTAVEPGFFSAFPGFEPQAARALGPDTLAMLDFSDPSRTVRDLLDQASAARRRWPTPSTAWRPGCGGAGWTSRGACCRCCGERRLSRSPPPEGLPRATLMASGRRRGEVRPAVARLRPR